MTSDSRRSSLHVYNARCALTVDPSRNRADTVHTVNLETATRSAAGADFAWDAKLVVQVTGRELPDVVATLLGLRSRVECLHHGPRRDKGYRLFHDGERCVVQLFSGDSGRHTVSLAPADRLGVVAMMFRQLQRNHGGLPADVLYAMLERVYATPSAEETGTAGTAGTAGTDAGGAAPTNPPSPPPAAGDAYDW